MKAQVPAGGRIINMGSISSKTPRADSLPYTTTKFALQGMTHQLTMDGRKHNIVASIIHPGSTLSSFTTRTGRTKAGAGEKPEDYVMSAEDVAKVAVLMASLPPEVICMKQRFCQTTSDHLSAGVSRSRAAAISSGSYRPRLRRP